MRERNKSIGSFNEFPIDFLAQPDIERVFADFLNEGDFTTFELHNIF